MEGSSRFALQWEEPGGVSISLIIVETIESHFLPSFSLEGAALENFMWEESELENCSSVSVGEMRKITLFLNCAIINEREVV